MYLNPLRSSTPDGFLDDCRLYSFTPLTPPQRQASRDLKDNTSVASSDVLSDFDPAELTFTQSQHDLTLNNLNASTSSSSSILSTERSVVSPTPLNASILGTGVQRRDSTARLQRRDSGSVAGQVAHHRKSNPQLHSQFISTSTGTMTGQMNHSTSSTIPATGFNLHQSLNLGTRPSLHFRSLSSPTGEGDMRSASPVIGSGYGAPGDGVPQSNAKSMYKLCHRGCFFYPLCPLPTHFVPLRTRDRRTKSGRVGAHQMLFDARKRRNGDLLPVYRSIPRGQEDREGVFKSQLGTHHPFFSLPKKGISVSEWISNRPCRQT